MHLGTVINAEWREVTEIKGRKLLKMHVPLWSREGYLV